MRGQANGSADIQVCFNREASEAAPARMELAGEMRQLRLQKRSGTSLLSDSLR